MAGSLPIVDLMHATQIAKPFHRSGWIYEEKVDGWRLVVYKDRSGIRLVRRAGRDHTARFPGIVAAVRGARPEHPRARWRGGRL